MQEKQEQGHSIAEFNKMEIESQKLASVHAENVKASMTVQVHHLKEENDLETMKMTLEKKQKLAEMKRDEMLEKRVETAHHLGAKRSPSKDQAPPM
jgi:hypothetical protein